MRNFKMICTIFTLAVMFNYQSLASADEGDRRIKEAGTQPVSMQEDTDGELNQNEYERVSTNDSITRALCPYTCDMRGLTQEICRSWKSLVDPSKCYVQDTRLPSNAIEFK